jgi:hypothetical protein
MSLLRAGRACSLLRVRGASGQLLRSTFVPGFSRELGAIRPSQHCPAFIPLASPGQYQGDIVRLFLVANPIIHGCCDNFADARQRQIAVGLNDFD